MQRLEGLVSELNREIELGGDSTPRAHELRELISELTREDAKIAAYISRLGEQNSAIPPPYDGERKYPIVLRWDGRDA
jgi:HEPN domain-containing protein